MTLWISIPGSPAEHHPMPADAPETAIRAIHALSKSIDDKELFGFLDPTFPHAAWWPGPAEGELHVGCSPRLFRGLIEFRWRRLWQDDTWYEPGWHPNFNFFALDGWLRGALWNALNPGKRPPQVPRADGKGRYY